MKILLSLLLAVSLWAGQSLSTSGASGTFSPPNAAPFNAMSQFRYELRIYNWQACTNDFSTVSRFGAANRLELRYGPCSGNQMYWCDGASSFCTVLNFATLGYTDIILRLQWTQGGQMVMQACPATGGAMSTDQRAEGYAAAQNISGSSMFPQSGVGTMQIAWARVYSTTVPVTDPCPKNYVVGTPILDWEFEGDATDETGNADITLTGGSFPTTPVYDPVAVPALTGAPAWANGFWTVRAANAFSVNANSSLVFTDSSAFSCRWSQVSGPTSLAGLPSTNCSPSITGSTFGEYVLSLRIIDVAGALSTAVNMTIGSVPTTDAGIVVHGEAHRKMFGQKLRWGLTPWGQDDLAQRTLADSFGAAIPAAEWNTNIKAGTITLTNGSLTVTGSGTNFQVDYCNGGTVPDNGLMVARTATTYRYITITSCDSATQITMVAGLQWPFATASGVTHAKIVNAGSWTGGSDNANYYDNVLAFYDLYYRTGRSVYKTYAETLADRWYDSPTIQGQRSVISGCMYPCNQNPASRVKAYMGLMWRAAHGQSGWWPDLRTALNRSDITANATIPDIREEAYEVAFQSAAAILDPDSAQRSQWSNNVLAAITNRWAPRRDGTTGQWLVPSVFYGDTSYLTPVLVTNGSTTVQANTRGNANWTAAGPATTSSLPTNVGNGTIALDAVAPVVVGTYGFVSIRFTAASANNGTFEVRNVFGTLLGTVVMSGGTGAFDGAVKFTVADGTIDFAVGDGFDISIYPFTQFAVLGESAGYIVTAGYTGGTNGTFRISPAYSGATRTVAAGDYALGTVAGSGILPFMAQMVSSTWRLAYEATGSTTARQWAIDGAEFVRTSGVRSDTQGLFYARGYPACEPGSTANTSPSACTVSAPNVDTSLSAVKAADRYLSLEGFPFGFSYIQSSDADFKTTGDLLYGAAFGQLGGPSTDAVWVDLADGKPKTFGFAFGAFGGAATWPGSRNGAVAPAVTRTFRIGVSAAGATTIQVRFTLADGTTVTSSNCAGSACEIPADVRLGGAQMQILRDGVPGPYQPVRF